jgi:pimeloyl-ACP methyl ester carboxylesterase
MTNMIFRLIFLIVVFVLPCVAIFTGLSCLPLQATGPKPEAYPECVILLHGLGRTSDSMDDMARALKDAGFDTINLDYPSREFSVETLAMDIIPRGIRHCRAQGAKKLHFVTHSMGGILLRYYLTQRSIENFGRAVMLSPPNQGSELVDELKDNALYQWYHGPAGLQLGTGPDSFVAGLGPVNYPVGVITGNTHAIFDAWFASKIPGDDDGKVSVERAKVEGMTDFLELPFSHPFIMQKEAVAEQTIHFLHHGMFHRPSETGGEAFTGGK